MKCDAMEVGYCGRAAVYLHVVEETGEHIHACEFCAPELIDEIETVEQAIQRSPVRCRCRNAGRTDTEKTIRVNFTYEVEAYIELNESVFVANFGGSPDEVTEHYVARQLDESGLAADAQILSTSSYNVTEIEPPR